MPRESIVKHLRYLTCFLCAGSAMIGRNTRAYEKSLWYSKSDQSYRSAITEGTHSSSQPRYCLMMQKKMVCPSCFVQEGKVKHGFITFPSDNDYFLLFVSLLKTIKININDSRWIYVVWSAYRRWYLVLRYQVSSVSTCPFAWPIRNLVTYSIRQTFKNSPKIEFCEFIENSKRSQLEMYPGTPASNI